MALVCGLAAALLMDGLILPREDNTKRTVAVIVAAEEIAGHTIVTPEMLTTQEYPIALQPANSFTADQMDELVRGDRTITRFPLLAGPRFWTANRRTLWG